MSSPSVFRMLISRPSLPTSSDAEASLPGWYAAFGALEPFTCHDIDGLLSSTSVIERSFDLRGVLYGVRDAQAVLVPSAIGREKVLDAAVYAYRLARVRGRPRCCRPTVR